MTKRDEINGYCALHDWIRRRKPQPESCEDCHEVTKSLDLANVSGAYKRDLSDWKYLCRSCHMASDGRLSAMVMRNKSARLQDKTCIVCGKVYKPKRLTTLFCSKSCHRRYANLNRIGVIYA